MQLAAPAELRPSAAWLQVEAAELPPGDAWLAAAERETAAGMRFAKRRADYLLARFAGKLALARALGLAAEPAVLRRIEVAGRRSGPERGAPLARIDGSPAPFELSLSDREDRAICALLAPGTRVGCDLELVEPRSGVFVADYFTADERARVARARGEEERQVLANLIWCAKESALKVLRTGLRRDTRSVEVQLEEELLGAEAWRPLRVAPREGGTFPGWWKRSGRFLLAVVADAETQPPEFLVDPRLERVVPLGAGLR